MGSNAGAKLTLYTNHRCPWAHRVHIALNELKIPYDEVIIDLDRPRDPWYLEINPRGLVPTIKHGDQIIPESAIVSHYLADLHPSTLIPSSDSEGGALKRARVAFFVDAYMSKVQSQLFKLGGAKTEEEQNAVGEAIVAAAVKELEPLLADAKPFYGGSDKIGLAEVLTGSFVIRLISLTKAGVYPANVSSGLKEKAPNTLRWLEAVAAHPSVGSIFDEGKVVETTRNRLAKARGA